MHTKTLWACDFFSNKVWTLRGLVEYFVLFFIQPGTRQVHIAGITANPDGAWMAQQACNLGMFLDDQPERAKYLVCDRDTKFTKRFQAILESEGIEVVQTAVRAPNQNAHLERFHRSIAEECLDRMIFFGEASLRNAVREYLAHYHAERNHQGMENRLIEPGPEVGQIASVIECRERLGGMLRYYYRKAA